ncbi:uncharacterized protein SPPG_03814 [Spizellomyces punctatus DAOM BR117]|uniref:G-protein coupled receptors family 1 profile domain-containing protein n=1 Tax=Spizellomyces punctatus (strain DAOM BR117) TaxID=645134 RepID=A0A0L0HHX7_SPIPD|nr:uncharacterized protein SPPG_03814 [Spizellomyces punctatus DAOM BR117]KND00693.1 hypothetical protein SPPG_03814 [Spizellomyces punctatus DAOM BR117]|eukprot:XP_016608732.1 hypothetical protein SPPG_03814 [Spizellomyces punctatus DAOM BR117]
MTMDYTLGFEYTNWSFYVEVILSAIQICGVIFNGFALILYCNYRELRTRPNYLTASLIVADLCFCAGCLLVHIFNFAAGAAPGVTGWDNIKCQFIGVWIMTTDASALGSLAAIATERWFTIVKGITLSKWQVISLAAGVWLWGGFMSGLQYSFGGHYVLQASASYCVGQWHGHEAKQLIFTLLTFTTIVGTYMWFVYVYWSIYRFVKFVHARMQSALDNGGLSDTTVATDERDFQIRLAIKSAILVGVFTICWTPEHMYFLYEMISGRPSPAWLDSVGVIMLVINAAVDPLVILMLDSRWKRASRSILRLPEPTPRDVNGKLAK